MTDAEVLTPSAALTDDERFAAALAALGVSPPVLRRFLDGYTPPDAWDALGRGVHGADPAGRYRSLIEPALIERVEALCRATGASVHVLGGVDYPRSLAGDLQAPAVLFSLGNAAVLDGKPRVAVVGTRGATPYGVGVASELGRALADADVVVISGLAAGIDAAAHAGVLSICGPGEPVGVLGTAFDAPGPRAHSALRDGVATRGVLLSELAPGSPSAKWWFAVRNRVIAAMAHVVVVVECHAKGGSLHTVAAAVRRGITVAAVPGSVRSAASFGTNALLADGGAQLVRGVDDVLTAVDLAIAHHRDVRPPSRRPSSTTAPVRPGVSLAMASKEARAVAAALDLDPASIDTIVRRSGLALGPVALALEQLSALKGAEESHGFWSLPRS